MLTTRFFYSTMVAFLLIVQQVLYKPLDTYANDIIDSWQTKTDLPYHIANHTSITHNNNIYVIDGSATFGGSHDEVLRSAVDLNGDIPSWNTISTLPLKLIWHSSTFNSEYVFVLGGYLDNIDNLNQNVNNVYMAKFENDDSLSNWTTLNQLPETLSLGAAMIVGNKIYYAGGVTDAHFMYQTAQTNIYVATIDNTDGSISNWSVAGQLQSPNFGMKIVNIGDYFYEIGGYGSNSSWHVRRAPINPDGTIGAWEEQSSLPVSLAMFGLAKIDNYLLTIGGDAGGQTKKIYYSQINPDSSIGVWNEVSQSSYLPNFIGNNAVSVIDNRIYSIGGYNTSDGYLNSVYMTEFNLPSTPSPTPTVSPSPSPEPTQTPIPSPSFSPTKKVFFAPGFGGSWNLDAIINCKTDNYSGEWLLSPFAKDIYKQFFDGVNSTNWKLNTFYYDWRQDVRSNGDILNSYINANSLVNEKVNFIGHSMGGLVGRAYMENYLGGKFDSYLSVGTPHRGVVFSYPTVSAAEVESDDLVQKIASTFLIKRCGVPESVQNTLPIFDYLKDKGTGTIKPVNSMIVQNNYLPTNFASPFWGVRVGTLSGQGEKTLKMYEVTNPSPIDVLKNKWLDGKPVKRITDIDGDGTVLLSSSQLPDTSLNTVINQSHSGIIGATEGVNKILEFLGNEPVEDPPFYEPESALVMVGYPGNFWVKDKTGNIKQSDQGVISIINPKTMDYELNIIPQNQTTLFIVAQFLPNGEIKYKEYKYKGLLPINKKINFSLEKPKEDILN